MNIDKTLFMCLKHVGIAVEDGENESGDDFISDSLTFITLIVEIEQAFKIEIPDEYLNMERMANLSSIREMIKEQIKKKKNYREAHGSKEDKNEGNRKKKQRSKSKSNKKTSKKDVQKKQSR